MIAPAAAAAIILGVVSSVLLRDQGGLSGHRAPTVAVTSAPRPIAPVGRGRVDTLRWTAVSLTDRYRVTLFDADGSVLWEVLTPDTAVGLPDSASLRAGGTYYWKVEARISWDRWVASPLTPFQRGGPAGGK